MTADPADPGLRALWPLDPEVAFLNHGSFGATPRVVLDAQAEIQRRLERNPVDFFMRFFPGALATAREAVAAFLGADPGGLAFVSNASAAVSTVIHNIALTPGDELLVTDHAYGACRNAFEHHAARHGARVVVASVPFPGTTSDLVVDAVLAAATPRTKLALIDHITSPTGLVFPVERIVPALAERGIDTLVDGAHAPGSVDLAIDRLAPAYYIGNGHKWSCAPKGAGFLWVRADRRDGFHPLVISHGLTRPLQPGETRFRAEHDWTGTDDPATVLCWPIAIDVVGSLLPGGWPAIRRRNHAAAVAARRVLCDLLGIAAPAPDDMLAALATVPLPDGPAMTLADRLWREHKIEVPVFPWPAPPKRFLRVAMHLHTRPADLARLVVALPGALAATA
ncbi:MAG: aminotransferase class V-fold PLP-dependent enzyme [Myxococcota bacterium]